MARKVVVGVGTTKGAFLYTSDEGRKDWKMTGPHLPGWEVYSLFSDNRRNNRLFAGTSHYVYGPTIRYSDDFGENWTQVESTPAYGDESGFKLKRIWQIAKQSDDAPDTLYAGAEEAGLFVSRDGGDNWTELSGLTSHPTRPHWFPGNGGLCLHTVLVDPKNADRIWVGISAVGCLRSDDEGKNWQVCNKGLPELVTETPAPEIGRCVHKMVADPNDNNTLYMQYHGGVFRTNDGANTWHRIEQGLPSNFGFPMGISARGHLFVVPLRSDEQRYVMGGDLKVFRSTDKGESWEPRGNEIQGPQYVGVLRDGLDVDKLDPAGIYFGTTMGDVYASVDGGDSWQALPGKFSRITCVKSWVTGQ